MDYNRIKIDMQRPVRTLKRRDRDHYVVDILTISQSFFQTCSDTFCKFPEHTTIPESTKV